MYLENTTIENIVADQFILDELMLQHDLVRGGQWDYERLTYDKKYTLKEGTFYLRIFGYALDGDIDKRNATVQLKKPVIGKHYYPFGVEYGEDENFPESLVNDCKATLKKVATALKEYNLNKA